MANQELHTGCAGCIVREKTIFCRVLPENPPEPPKRRLSFPAGEYLFREGQASRGVFCVSKGKLLVKKDGSDGSACTLTEAGPGELLGMSSIFSEGAYSTSIYCQTEVEACLIAAEDFESMLGRWPKLRLNAMQILVQKLNSLEKHNPEKIMSRFPVRAAIFAFIVGMAVLYSGLVYTKGTEVINGQITGEAAQHGKLLYQKYNCTACHQIYGLGGYMGPDLTNVMSAKGKGEPYVKAFLQNGTSRMPNFNLDEGEIAALTEFLRQTDRSGRSPLVNPELTWWGDVRVPN